MFIVLSKDKPRWKFVEGFELTIRFLYFVKFMLKGIYGLYFSSKLPKTKSYLAN